MGQISSSLRSSALFVRRLILPLPTIGGATMSHARRRTVALNDRAVRLLQQNEQDQAAYLLRKSLKMLLVEVVKEKVSSPVSTSWMHLPHDKESEKKLVFTVPIDDVSEEHEEASPCNIFAFFNRAFVLVDDHDQTLTSTDYQHETTAMLLYNMGLCYHSKGIRIGDSKALERALYFYQLAHKTLTENQPLFDETLARFILLALTNNLGHVHSHFFNLEGTTSCHDHLILLLSGAAFDTTMSDDEYLFFFKSMYYFLDVKTVASPAA